MYYIYNTFMDDIRHFSDFELRSLDNNIWDAEYMTALIQDWSKQVVALFIATDNTNPSGDDRFSLIAAKRAGKLSPHDFKELREICPATDGKYFHAMLLIKHVHKPLEHTLIVAQNVRWLNPETFEGDSKKPFDYSKTELEWDEAPLAVKALIKYAPRANLLFLSNATVWKDGKTLKEAMEYHVDLQVKEYLSRWWSNKEDYYGGDWITAY